jgi:hypothetical protein
MIKIIGIFIVFGLFIFLITGLGILTKEIFEIKPDTTTVFVAAVAGTKNAGLVEYIKKRPLDEKYTKEQQDKEIADIPETGAEAATTKEVSNGQYLINLKGSNLTVAKISLMSFWIFIILGILYGSYRILFKF